MKIEFVENRIIFNFETFSECQVGGQNCFEQLCINYINEKVQQFWMRKQIKDELDWYAVDGIHIPDVNFLDNRTILSKFDLSLPSIIVAFVIFTMYIRPAL